MSQEAIAAYWETKLEKTKNALLENNFAVWIAQDIEQAKTLFWQEIFRQVNPRVVSFGGSTTIQDSGLYSDLKQREDLQVIDTYDFSIPLEDVLERRRQSLLADLFITSTNALTSSGQLVNLDGFGNRVAGITFGPRHVVLFIGRNKIVEDLEQAIARIKEYTAPVNAYRLSKKTPCVANFECQECNSQDRICNTWAITEKSNPPQRVKIILINSELGY